MMGRPQLPPALSGRSSITATPSPRPYPSAATSNVRQRPAADRACSWQMAAVVPTSCMRFTPATSAAPHSPSSRPYKLHICFRVRVTRFRTSCMRFTPATSASPHSPSSRPWDPQLRSRLG